MVFELQLSSADPLHSAADVLAVCVFQQPLDKQAPFSALDKELGQALLEHAKHVEFQGKNEQLLEVPGLGRFKARRLLLVGLGKRDDLDDARLRAAAAHAARAAIGANARSLVFVAPPDSDARILGEGLVLGAYRFSKYFTGDRKPKVQLSKISVVIPGKPNPAAKKQLELGRGIAESVCLARDAVNEPPNELYPAKLAELAKQVARKYKLGATVLDQKGIDAAGMKLLTAVGQGSVNKPRFIHLSYKPRGAKKRLVFVGKGLTFDSGGLCIKPAPGMGEMKSDMGGAAAVLGLMACIGLVKPNVEVHGIIASAENMPDGEAYRPGDIFGSLGGKTVEIINTDAEGRLVLADALAYSVELEPDVIVNAATLTGAAIVALGKTHTAYYATEDALSARVNSAAKLAGEGFWRMPLIEELAEQLKSDVADLKHTGERWGGSITAALFLREFVGDVPWIHCDIAGPSFTERPRGIHPKGGTGHPVLTFLKFVESYT